MKSASKPRRLAGTWAALDAVTMLARPPSSSKTIGSAFTARSLRLASPLILAALPLLGCRNPFDHAEPSSNPLVTAPSSTVAAASSSAALVVTKPAPLPNYAPSHAGCETVEVMRDGQSAGSLCADDVAKNGLTVIDLSDTWTPRVFAPEPVTHDAPEYRSKYLELANQSTADLGLYGIAPSISLVANRLADEKRAACDASIDLVPIKKLHADLVAAQDDKARAWLTTGPQAKEALIAIRGELGCAGLLSTRGAPSPNGASMQAALDSFRRRHMVVGTGLDAATVEALALGGEELDFRGLLRTLRERVAEAGGILEDGTASEEQVLVAGRKLDLTRFAPSVHQALDGGAPDLVDAATDMAAQALGWSTPAKAEAFLVARGIETVRSLRVAVTLPAPPSYYSAHMELRVEVDRGDVFYEMPGQAAAERKKMTDVRGPSFVLYAKDGERDRPLIRWATTIGGWKKERTEDGEMALKYKESDVGDRVWRQVVAAPAWMPPDSTPETDLLHEGKDGSFALKRDLIQPGFRNAYGLVMLIHEEVVTHGSETTYVDHGIRTHGSVDYRSITRGESHGCHRLYNQLALRLSGYLLAHRNNVRRGKMHSGYHRTLEWNDQSVDVDVPVRGYLYELDPPVPVRVLEGHVAGSALKPVSALIPLAPQSPNKG